MDNHTLRKQICQARRKLHPKARSYAGFLTHLHLKKLLPLLPKHAKIGLYLDAFGELPTDVLLEFCRRYGFLPYLPITKKGRALRFSRCQFNMRNTPLKRHAFGMKEPIATHTITANQLDAVFCPLVALDDTGNRLGMGGGFYDRTLARTPNLLKIGYCYDFQRVPKLKTKPWDQSMDLAIGDFGIVRFKH
ncbi:5-formyltetrahydrofolate cyclo-ligase [Moraxella nasovis]|uniref:5-formyltetrahydrofolate cyclo-ligase n=1 Tax=Moraxella nasovis TaxID=2904121 RepID=UPI001F6008F8|nr:5-formyltetrahydrofolate cyclo-ligase [Moraxella nasovis]UNU73162.1 5-formyltetrahydrofolate cyclo-ligase [Moraxella nasovis]